jgi:hypothetical protein
VNAAAGASPVITRDEGARREWRNQPVSYLRRCGCGCRVPMAPRRGIRYGKLRGGRRDDRTVAAGLDQTGDIADEVISRPSHRRWSLARGRPGRSYGAFTLYGEAEQRKVQPFGCGGHGLASSSSTSA